MGDLRRCITSTLVAHLGTHPENSYHVRTLRIRAVDITYLDHGAGCPVLFIHGHPFDHTMWHPQISALTNRGYRVIAPDLRGYGNTPVTSQITHLDTFARDLHGLLEHLDLDTVDVVGLSMGGQIALELCRLFPDRVDTLTLVATNPRAETDEGRTFRKQLAEQLLLEGMRGYADRMLVGMMSADNVRQLPQVAQHVHAMMCATCPKGAAAALLGRAQRPDHMPLLRRLSAPTLLLVGRQDHFTPPDFTEAMHVWVPDSLVSIIDGAGHLPNLERPEQFNTVLLRFLDRHRLGN